MQRATIVWKSGAARTGSPSWNCANQLTKLNNRQTIGAYLNGYPLIKMTIVSNDSKFRYLLYPTQCIMRYCIDICRAAVRHKLFTNSLVLHRQRWLIAVRCGIWLNPNSRSSTLINNNWNSELTFVRTGWAIIWVSSRSRRAQMKSATTSIKSAREFDYYWMARNHAHSCL